MMSTPSPRLMYGYLRLDLITGCVDESQAQLEAFAAEHGYQLAGVFHEPATNPSTLPPSSTSLPFLPPGFLELARACRDSDVREVVTLPGHLAGMPMPQKHLLTFLAARGHAQVFTAPRTSKARYGDLITLDGGLDFDRKFHDEHYRWTEWVAALTAYILDHGHADIPATHITADGHHLGRWLIACRNSVRAGTLAADRIALLADLGVHLGVSNTFGRPGAAASKPDAA
ncbi:helicase associated domain-containing protein [Nocardia sp. NPDC088792]|uniref:helicase associated domain-containing protein n=1 Tax=Nocardia sp. NPDC088792 TaxID=3364332 RepID=UPI0037FA9ACB